MVLEERKGELCCSSSQMLSHHLPPIQITQITFRSFSDRSVSTRPGMPADGRGLLSHTSAKSLARAASARAASQR